jgi:two-component system, LytTR family, sensor kinase
MVRFLKYLCLVCCFLFATSEIKAQVNVDSLKRVLNKTKVNMKNIHAYLFYADHKLSTSQLEASMAIIDWALKNSARKKLYPGYVLALQYKGQLQFQMNHYIDATKTYVKALHFAEKHKLHVDEIEILRMLASFYADNEQYSKGIDCLKNAIIKCKKYGIEKPLGVYVTLAGVSFNYSMLNSQDSSEAIYYCKLGLPAVMKTKDTTNIILTHMLMANIYSNQEKYDSAMYAVKKGEEIALQAKDIETLKSLLGYKGNVLFAQKKYTEAIPVYKRCIDLAKQFKSPHDEYLSYYNLSQVYDSLGDHYHAFVYSQSYVQLHDSIVSTENFLAAADIQNKYERERKEKEILKLNKDNVIKKLQLVASNEKKSQLLLFLISSLAVLVVLIILSILLLRNIQDRKKAFVELEQIGINIQRQSVQLNKQSRLIAQFQSQMNPHFVFNALNNVQGLVINNEDKKATKQIQSLAQLMRRTFSNAEKEEIMIQEEIDYLQRYIDFEQSALEYSIDFRIIVSKGAENALIPPMMIQPFVENCIKHGQLKTVDKPFIEVSIEANNELLCITVKDNGIGFDSEKADPSKISHSVSVIRSRIELLFQSIDRTDHIPFKTTSKPDHGTTVVFYLPYNESF